MAHSPIGRRVSAELLGSLLLVATVVGSGIMAESLSKGNGALALLANSGATVAVLACLIALLRPISGAHFNPAVTFVMALVRQPTGSPLLLHSPIRPSQSRGR